MNGADHQSAAEIHAKLAPNKAVRGVSCTRTPLVCGPPRRGAQRADRRALRPLDEVRSRPVLSTAQRHKVGMMTMVGDAYAAPLVVRFGMAATTCRRCTPWRPGERRPTPSPAWHRWRSCPTSSWINGYGSRRPATSDSAAACATTTRTPSNCAEHWFRADDYSRFLGPGEDQVGWWRQGRANSVGLLDDAEATRVTFPRSTGSAW